MKYTKIFIFALAAIIITTVVVPDKEAEVIKCPDNFTSTASHRQQIYIYKNKSGGQNIYRVPYSYSNGHKVKDSK